MLPSGKVLIAGGWKNGITYLFDPEAGSFRPVGSSHLYPFSRYWHTATLLRNGTVLVTGGDNAGDNSNPTAEAALYDLAAERFIGSGSMAARRQLHSATLLPGGTVLVADGISGELYDPASGTFSIVPSIPGFSDFHGAVLLQDGRVLLAGRQEAALYTPPVRAVSAASLTAPLAAGSLASLMGSRLAASTASAEAQSFPTTLGGVSLRIRDRTGQETLAPLSYVSPAQINFQVPPGIATGDVTLDVVNSPSNVGGVTAAVQPVAPGLFALADGSAAAYGVRNEAGGRQTVLPPGAVVLDERPVHLVVYATGVRNRTSLSNVHAAIGGVRVPVVYAGPAGDGVPGLDQVNIELTAALKGQGHQDLTLTVDGIASNPVRLELR